MDDRYRDGISSELGHIPGLSDEVGLRWAGAYSLHYTRLLICHFTVIIMFIRSRIESGSDRARRGSPMSYNFALQSARAAGFVTAWTRRR